MLYIDYQRGYKMRNLDVAIEEMLKMQQYISQLKELRPGSFGDCIEDMRTKYIELGECGILDPKFAVEIAPSTDLRNRLVHEYEKIDDKIVYDSINKVIDMYITYMKKINQFIG